MTDSAKQENRPEPPKAPMWWGGPAGLLTLAVVFTESWVRWLLFSALMAGWAVWWRMHIRRARWVVENAPATRKGGLR